MIQKKERLRGDGADIALAHRGIDVAEVERLEKLQPLVAKCGHIDAAARVGEDVAVLDVLRAEVVRIDIAGLRDVRPADVQLQRAARREDAVANLLGVEPAAVCVREKAVLGIAPARRGYRELPRPREHDFVDQLFHTPALGREPQREMIEQLRVRRLLSGRAEIIHRPHQPCAKEPVPDSVHGHSRGQRIARVGDPLREFAPSAFLWRRRGRFLRHRHTEKAARHRFARLLHLPADANLCVRDPVVIAHRHRGRAVRPVFGERLQIRLQRLHPLLRGALSAGVWARVFREFRHSLVAFRHELQRIDCDIAARPVIRDEHVASAVHFKAELSERDKAPVDRRREGLIDEDIVLAVGVEDMDAHVFCASRGVCVGEPDLVAAGLRYRRGEGDGFPPLAGVSVVQVVLPDEAAHMGGADPVADDFGLRVVDDDAGKAVGGDRSAGLPGRLGRGLGSLRQRGLGGVEILAKRGEFSFVGEQRALLLAVERQRGGDPFRHIVRVVFERARAREDAGERVVIALRHGVELVVVAAGAADGLAEEGAPQRFELLVDDIEAELLLVLLLVVRGAEREESGGRELAAAVGGSGGGQEIAGKLLADEAVERHVGIQRLDDVVAVAPGVLEKQRAPAAARLGEARNIEPVPAPLFAKLRGGEQRIDERGDCGMRIPACGIGERIELLRRGRQAGERVVDAAAESGGRGVGCGLRAGGFDPREDEAVDVSARPRVRFHRGNRGLRHRGVAPEFAPVIERKAGLLFRDCTAGARIGRAHFHPLLQHGDLGVGQLALLRHL